MKPFFVLLLILSFQSANAENYWNSFKDKFISGSARGDGDASAFHSYSILVQDIPGTSQNAYELAKQSASTSNPYGLYVLGMCYEKGAGTDRDEARFTYFYDKAFSELKRRAVKDGGIALLLMGSCYEKGRGVPKNPAEAVKWYRKAADLGIPLAQRILGVCYINGNGIPKDLSEAVKWFRKAADQGNAGGQTDLGDLYVSGTGVSKDLNEAVKWYRKAADQGNEIALKSIGRLNPYEALGSAIKEISEMSRKLVSRTADSDANRDGGPKTEEILIAVQACTLEGHAPGQGQFVIKRGKTLVSQGGEINSGTRLFPIKLLCQVTDSRGFPMNLALTYRFWRNEFDEWRFEKTNL